MQRWFHCSRRGHLQTENKTSINNLKLKQTFHYIFGGGIIHLALGHVGLQDLEIIMQ